MHRYKVIHQPAHVFDLALLAYNVHSVYGFNQSSSHELIWHTMLAMFVRVVPSCLNNGYVSFVQFDCVHAFMCHRSCTHTHLSGAFDMV